MKKRSTRPSIGNAVKAKISSEQRRCFSFKFVTMGPPDATTKDGDIDDRLTTQYGRNHVFVSSQLPNYRFLLDNEISENPYWVGNTQVTNYQNWAYQKYVNGTNYDARRHVAGLVLPCDEQCRHTVGD